MSTRHRTPRSKLLLLIVCYYVASTMTSVLTKKILTSFPRPITVSFVQQLFACSGGLIRLGSVQAALAEWRAALPVAMTLLISVILYRISLVHNTLSLLASCEDSAATFCDHAECCAAARA